MRPSLFVTAALASMISNPASAGTFATVTHVEGKAMIIGTHNSIEAEAGTMTKSGTQLVVSFDGQASLMMDGCVISLASGSRFMIPDAAPCAAGERIDIGGVTITPANGYGGVEPPPPPSYAGGFPPKVVMLATAGLTMGSVIGFMLLQDNETDGASPH
jgi:hypothetical protein